MTDDSLAPARRGRPRDPERVRRVLESASRLFLELGYERTSMEAVAQDAGVSKMTLYSYFPCKASLFEAAVGQRTDQVLGMDLVADLDAQQPGPTLMKVGREFVRLMRDDDVIGHHRVLFGMGGGEHADVCEAFYRQGPERLTRHVAQYLQAAHQAGSLHVPQPEIAAGQFLSLFLGSPQYRMLLGVLRPTEQEDDLMLQANVDFFLRGYRPLSS